MALSRITERVTSDDHADHVSGDTVIRCDDLVWSARISADSTSLFRCELVPTMTAFVSKLLLWCRPTAVIRRVVAVVVDAIKRPLMLMSRRSGTHVSEEVFKLLPAVADSDASTTVVCKAMLLRVVATCKHLIPDEVFRGLDVCFGHPQILVQGRA